jgi:hypothetical protein
MVCTQSVRTFQGLAELFAPVGKGVAGLPDPDGVQHVKPIDTLHGHPTEFVQSQLVGRIRGTEKQQLGEQGRRAEQIVEAAETLHRQHTGRDRLHGVVDHRLRAEILQHVNERFHDVDVARRHTLLDKLKRRVAVARPDPSPQLLQRRAQPSM